MKTNSYQRIKDVIFTNLKKTVGILAVGQIKQEITNTQNLINTVGLDTYRQFLSDKSELYPLSDEDWQRMERELEIHFNVEMKVGVVIQGDEQKNRDNTWWTGKEKNIGSNYYWDRYKNYIKGFLPNEVVATIDKDTDVVMNNIGNPVDPRFNVFERKGMVVGHVQSGKTGNYTALVCKAADAGYSFIVVIAGGTNNLRNQTQKRLNEGFVGEDKGIQVGAGIGNSDKELLPFCLTTTERDFTKHDADTSSQSFTFDNTKTPVLVVIKKETKALANVYDWLKNQYPNKIDKHSILIIDDESDYASINTKGLNDPTAINKGIRALLNHFGKATYVAYTATPYANIFIDHQAVHGDYGDDLFPKDFIYVLEAPSNYFGAKRIFLDDHDGPRRISLGEFDQPIIKIPEEDLEILPLKHKIDHIPPYLPESLKQAIRLFIINVAVRKIRGQEGEHNSMLVHISRFTSLHKKIAAYIEEYLDEIKADINVYGKLPDADIHSTHINQIKNTCEIIHTNRSPDETLERILDGICSTVGSIKVKQVHIEEKVPLEYRRDFPTNAIVVGGASLARGFTLEGLNVSYFIRSTIFYDTLMQMGRWFGYRPGYEDLCRIFMPEDTVDYFQGIITATNELFKRFEEMADDNLTPAEFGLYVQQHPDSVLQVTARNKQKNTKEIFFDMNLNGHLKETAYLSSGEDRRANLRTIKTIVNKLGNRPFEMPNKSKSKSAEDGTAYLWRDVEMEIVKEFLGKFRTYIKGSKDPLGIFTRFPTDFIKKYVEEYGNSWDVALYSGTGEQYKEFENKEIIINKERRKIDWNGKKECFEVRNRQVSSGTAEAISLTDSQRAEVKGDRFAARVKLPRPLLMLHILEKENLAENEERKDYAACGVSFPCPNGIRTNKTVRLKINTVYYKEYLKKLEDETNDE